MKKLFAFWSFGCWSLLTASALVYGADTAPDPKVVSSVVFKLTELTGPLAENTVYGLDLDTDVMVSAFPAGLVTIEQATLTAPTRMKATWADTGKFEWRTFKGKTAVTVEPVAGADGIATLVIVPVGAKTVAEWRTQTVEVRSGKGPLPPPSSLKSDVKSAFDKDTTEALGKASAAGKLAKLYRASASPQFLSKYGPTTTWYEVFQDMAAANGAQMGPNDLKPVREVVRKYLDARLPTDSKTLLDPKLAAAEFGAVATALEVLAK